MKLRTVPQFWEEDQFCSVRVNKILNSMKHESGPGVNPPLVADNHTAMYFGMRASEISDSHRFFYQTVIELENSDHDFSNEFKRQEFFDCCKCLKASLLKIENLTREVNDTALLEHLTRLYKELNNLLNRAERSYKHSCNSFILSGETDSSLIDALHDLISKMTILHEEIDSLTELSKSLFN